MEIFVTEEQVIEQLLRMMHQEAMDMGLCHTIDGKPIYEDHYPFNKLEPTDARHNEFNGP